MYFPFLNVYLCICPLYLREPWRWMAAKFYSQLEEGNLCTTSYEDLVSSLEEVNDIAVYRKNNKQFHKYTCVL